MAKKKLQPARIAFILPFHMLSMSAKESIGKSIAFIPVTTIRSKILGCSNVLKNRHEASELMNVSTFSSR